MDREPSSDTEAFRVALGDYTRAALHWLENTPARDLRLGARYESSIDDDPESFIYPDPSGQCAGILHSRRRPIHEVDLHALREYTTLAKVVSDDTVRQGVVGLSVYSGGRGRRIYLSDLTDGILLNMVHDGYSLEFSEDAFDEQFEWLDATLRDETVVHSKVAPLLHFYHPDAADIRLDDEVAISLLTRAEQRQCESWGYGEGYIKPAWCLRFRRTLPKEVSEEWSEADRAEVVRFNTEGLPAILRAITALRLLKEGVFCVPGVLDASSVGYEYRAGSTSPLLGDTRGVGIGQGYQLDVADIERLVEWWARYKEAMSSPLVEYSLMRFSMCGEGQRPEERLVNLFVCAESLLIKRSETRKLTERLRTRAAVLLGTDAASRARVDEFIKRACRARGAVVHGKVFSDKDAKGAPTPVTERLDGTNTGLGGMLEDLASLIRQLLILSLDLVPDGSRLSEVADRRIRGT